MVVAIVAALWLITVGEALAQEPVTESEAGVPEPATDVVDERPAEIASDSTAPGDDAAEPVLDRRTLRQAARERLKAVELRISALGELEVTDELAPPIARSHARSSIQRARLQALVETAAEPEAEALPVIATPLTEPNSEPARVSDVQRVLELTQEAEVAFDRAVEAEKGAVSEKLRELRSEERRTAGKILELTRSSRDELERLHQRSEELNQELSALVVQVRRAELGEEAFPSPTELRDVLISIYERVRVVRARLREVAAELELKRVRLSSIEESLEDFEGGNSEVRRRERAVLEANRSYRKLAIQLAEAELSLLERRSAELADHRALFEKGLRHALSDAPATQRREVQGLSDAAVNFAGMVASDRARQARILWREAPRYLESSARHLSSIDFWVWVAGLLLSVLPLLFFLVFRRWIPSILGRLSRWVSKLASARRNPHFVGRFFELLTAIVRPSLNYAVIMVIVGYVETRFAQVSFLAELVTAYFVYRIAISAAEMTRPTPERLEHADEEYRDLIAHLRWIAGDPKWLSTQASRELRSTVVEIFTVWLMVRTAQILVDELFGFTLIDAFTNNVGAAALVIVVLKGVSQWRATIARLFAKVAPERFAPTVEFVNRHAQRWYGLVVVAFALIYIIVHEVVVFTRRFVSSTAWFRALNKFIFRARFQRRLRDREAQPLQPAPPAYLELFGSSDVFPGGRLERPSDVQVEEMWTSWQENPRGGHVVCAPPGGGKSAELARLRALVDSTDAGSTMTTVFVALTGRMHRSDDFLTWLCDLLDLRVKPLADLEVVIDELLAMAPHALFIDDANRCFARAVEGYDAFETMTHVVRATSRRHFWCLGFDLHAWVFVNYVRPRSHRFARVVTIPPLELDETSDLIVQRHAVSGFDLELDQDDVVMEELDREAELAGFIRYIHETTSGNLACALAVWRRSAKVSGDSSIVMRLDAAPRLPTRVGDNGWFLLSALVQHGPLSLGELARIENEDEGDIATLMGIFVDHGVVERNRAGEFAITSIHYPQVVRNLVGSNFLYGPS